MQLNKYNSNVPGIAIAMVNLHDRKIGTKRVYIILKI